MGHFIRARILDSTASAFQGSVLASSDVDTLTVTSDSTGAIVLPKKPRRWIHFLSDRGAYLLDSACTGGDLGRITIGRPRPLTGWIDSAADLSIAGIGKAARSGSMFRFATIPPGRIRLAIRKDSVSGIVPLRIDAPAGSNSPTPPRDRDSLFLPPLSTVVMERIPGGDSGARSLAIKVAHPGDTVACATSCTGESWIKANLLVPGSGEIAAQTYSLIATDTSRIVTSIFLTSWEALAIEYRKTTPARILSIEDRGRWVLLKLLLSGTNSYPILIDSTMGAGSDILLAATTISDTLEDPDSAIVHLVALDRSKKPGLAGPLRFFVGRSGVVGSVPAANPLAGDACSPSSRAGLFDCMGSDSRHWMLEGELLRNPDFETGAATPEDWSSDEWTAGNSTFSYGDFGVDGSKGVKIDALTADDARWFQTVTGLVPGQTYIIRGQAMATNLVNQDGGRMGANVSILEGHDNSGVDRLGTFEWRPLRCLFKADSTGTARIGARIGHFASLVTGTAMFDNMSLTRLP